MNRPTRTPRELRYWDYEQDGPVPDEYWEARARAAKVAHDHQQEKDNLLMWLVFAVLVSLPASLAIAHFLGHGPF